MIPALGFGSVAAGLAVILWTGDAVDHCSDECHGFAVPALGGATLILFGVLTLAVWGYFTWMEGRTARQLANRDSRLLELRARMRGRD